MIVFIVSRLAGAAAAPTQDRAGASAEDLVAGAQADPHAFAPIYQRYVSAIYRYCYLRLGSREAAEDATSEVFLKALGNLRRYQKGAFAAWLYRIARNVVIDAYRRRRPTAMWVTAEHVDPAPSPEESAEAQVESEVLRAALARLPKNERAAIELQLAGWPGAQIAGALGKSVGAVKMLRYRAIGRLRRLLSSC